MSRAHIKLTLNCESSATFPLHWPTADVGSSRWEMYKGRARRRYPSDVFIATFQPQHFNADNRLAAEKIAFCENQVLLGLEVSYA